MSEQQQEHQEEHQEETPPETGHEEVPGSEVDETTGLSFEEAAANLGWASADAWMGDPAKHVDAKEFLRRGRESMPLMRSNMKRQDEKIATLEASIKYQNELHASEQKRLKDGFEAQMRAAVQEGDTDAYDAAKKGHDSVPDTRTAPAPSGASDAEAAFTERNPWYGVDDAKTAEVIIESARLMKEAPGLTQAQHDSAIERHIKKEFGPEKPGQKPGSPVGSPRRPGSPQAGRTFNDLPDDAKAAFKNFCRTKVFTDDDAGKKRYTDNYQWDK